MSFDTISRPYAQAIFEIAVRDNSIQKWKKTLIFINQVLSLKKIKKFLSGSLSPNYLSLFLIYVCSDYLDNYSKNLIKLLAENQRFEIFNHILQHFLKLENSYKNINVIQLTSAYFLKENYIIKIRSILEKKLSFKIKFIYKINKRILDGLLIKINDQVFDFSIQNHLKQLSFVLNF